MFGRKGGWHCCCTTLNKNNGKLNWQIYFPFNLISRAWRSDDPWNRGKIHISYSRRIFDLQSTANNFKTEWVFHNLDTCKVCDSPACQGQAMVKSRWSPTIVVKMASYLDCRNVWGLGQNLRENRERRRERKREKRVKQRREKREKSKEEESSWQYSTETGGLSFFVFLCRSRLPDTVAPLVDRQPGTNRQGRGWEQSRHRKIA